MCSAARDSSLRRAPVACTPTTIAVVINQVVVVIPHACRRAAFRRIRGVRIGGGHLSWLCVGSSTGFCISSSARHPRTVRLTCAVSSLIRTAEQLLINREALIRSTCLVGVEDYYGGDGVEGLWRGVGMSRPSPAWLVLRACGFCRRGGRRRLRCVGAWLYCRGGRAVWASVKISM